MRQRSENGLIHFTQVLPMRKHSRNYLLEVEGMKTTLIELIKNAPWREAVTYRDTWPQEYVLLQKDG